MRLGRAVEQQILDLPAGAGKVVPPVRLSASEKNQAQLGPLSCRSQSHLEEQRLENSETGLRIVEHDQAGRRSREQGVEIPGCAVCPEETGMPSEMPEMAAPLDHQPRLAGAALSREEQDALEFFAVAPLSKEIQLLVPPGVVEWDHLVGCGEELAGRCLLRELAVLSCRRCWTCFNSSKTVRIRSAPGVLAQLPRSVRAASMRSEKAFGVRVRSSGLGWLEARRTCATSLSRKVWAGRELVSSRAARTFSMRRWTASRSGASKDHSTESMKPFQPPGSASSQDRASVVSSRFLSSSLGSRRERTAAIADGPAAEEEAVEVLVSFAEEDLVGFEVEPAEDAQAGLVEVATEGGVGGARIAAVSFGFRRIGGRGHGSEDASRAGDQWPGNSSSPKSAVATVVGVVATKV